MTVSAYGAYHLLFLVLIRHPIRKLKMLLSTITRHLTNKKTCDKVGDMNKQQFKVDMEKLIKAVKADNEKSDKLYEYCGGMVESWCMDLAAGLMDRIYSPKDNWISW